MNELARRWDEFWFRPEQTSTLALVRIAFGLTVLAWTLTLAPDAGSFLGGDGLLPDQPGRAETGQRLVWGVLALSSSNLAVAATLTVLALACVCLIIGYHTRLAALLVFVGLVSIQRRNPFIFNSGDGLLRVTALYLALAPAGAALSLDRWRRASHAFWEFPARAPWALRLMQVQLSVVYLSTAWAKLRGTTWNDGTAVSYALRLDDLIRFDVPRAVANSEVLVNLLTYGALATELSVGILVWSRRLRPWVLGCGVLLHVGIDLALRVGFFSYAIFVLYIAFIPPETASAWALQVRDRVRSLPTLAALRTRRRRLAPPTVTD